MDGLFSGLPITTPVALPEVTAGLVRLELLRGVLMLLQYDGDTIGHCDRVEQMCRDGMVRDTNRDDHPGPMDSEMAPRQCMVAYALRCQILASIGYPIDLRPLELAVHKDAAVQYHPWELRHIAAVLVFCRERNFLKTVELTIDALVLEPRDIFSLRLLFISIFLCGDYVAAKEALGRLVFSAVPDVAARKQLTENLRLSNCQNEQFCRSSIPLVFLPYMISYYAFTVEESTHITLAGDYDAQIDDAEAWNTLAIQLIHHLNNSRDGDVVLASLPPFTHPFAMHVMCHVCESRGDPLGSIAAIEAHVPKALWVGTAHLVVHCWWHVALFYLDGGNFGEAMRVFDQHVMSAVVKLDPFGLSDSTAFLTRAVLSGELDPRRDSRFAAVEALWEYHVEDEVRRATIMEFPFFHIHLLLTKWMGESRASLSLGADACSSRSTAATASALTQCLALNSLSLVRDANVSEKGLEAVADFLKLRSMWVEIGGSAAQRDVLQRLCLYVVIQSASITSGAASLREALSSIVKEIVTKFPNQSYYAKLWQLHVESWHVDVARPS
jgi:hypothetical protein